ncbi:MAG: hypothetical protein ACK52I_12650 [Pseudomonadota bacterium]|jgi:hypothetical protein
MKDEEYRALVAAGPAVVMVAKEDMLKLLNRIILLTKANQLEDEIIKDYEDERERKCVNAHDRCYGGAGGPCDYCEFTICDND